MAGRIAPAARGMLLAACAALGWLGGVALQLQQPVLFGAATVAGMAVAGGLLLLAAWRWRAGGAAGALCLLLAAAALGFASTSGRAAWRLAGALDPALEGQDVRITGVIAQLPRVGPGGTRFVFDAESATLRGVPLAVPAHLALGWYAAPDDDGATSGPGVDLRAGQRWQLTVRLRAPHGSVNPNGFDAELWLFEQGIAGSGTVRSQPGSVAVRLAENAGHPIERLRQRVRDAIATHVADAKAAGVLAALAIGDQAAIERDGWDLFRATGVAHLMSISGLHVTMFAWLAAALIGRLWRWHPRLPLRLPAPQAARWGGLVAAASYALLAGWGVPAQRTVWMIGAVVLLRSSGVRWPLHAVLLAAMLAVVLADPWALLQAGFWLSFVAVALLVASEPVHAPGSRLAPVADWRQRLWHALRSGLRTQAVATVGLAPLTLVFFQQLSLVGFAANLVAIPLVTLLVAPLALAGVLLPPLWPLAALLVQALGGYLQALAALPLALWSAAAAPPWAVACGLLAGALAVLPLPLRLRLLALPLMLPLLAPPVARPAPGRFELVAADVGQGTAVLVRTHSHLLLFDTGPQYTPDADAGSRVLMPLLRARGDTQIDLLMLSHRDADHIGGAASLMAGVPVKQLASSLADDHPLLARRPPGTPHRRCDAGQAWDWDGVHFEVLHPLPADHAQQAKANALSCVLRVHARVQARVQARVEAQADPQVDAQAQAHAQDQVSHDGVLSSVLLTGDIEAPQEAALLQRAGDSLRSDVLIVPHHGSRTSSTAAFIAAVQPQVAVVQAAYRSRFGHPAPDVVARYAERGVAIVRTDRCGAWTLPAATTAGTAPPPPVCQRDAARRYWHHRVPAPAPATSP